MPSYQFAGLVIAFLKDDRMPESLDQIDSAFTAADDIPHPFHSSEFGVVVSSMGGTLARSRQTASARAIDNVIYDKRLTETLPVEERKRQEAQAKGKAYRVPEWWRGERANYQVAKQMMVTLPKKGKAPVRDK